MKPKSVILSTVKVQPGKVKEYNEWHDNDHGGEHTGAVNHIYNKNRWYAPAEYIEARGKINLEHFPDGGGQFFSAYWSTEPVEVLRRDANLTYNRLSACGRNLPFTSVLCYESDNPEDIAKGLVEWGYSYPIYCEKRRGLALSAEAIPCAPHSGIIVTIGEVKPGGDGMRWADWFMKEHIYDVLSLPGFRGFYKFMPENPSTGNVFVHMFFIEEGTNPLDAFYLYRAKVEEWKANGHYPVELVKNGIDTWFESPYRNTVRTFYDE